MYSGGDGMMHHIGIGDANFIRGNIPMTKQEIRILSIAKAKINDKDIIFDIGAGTGSLSIEAALLSPKGHVYAIERKAEGIELIHKNAEKFSVTNITPILGEAPEQINGLPNCDVVFIGGSGGKLQEIFNTIDCKLKIGGRLIINAITVETMYEALNYLKTSPNYTYNACRVQVTQLNQVGRYHMEESQNPITIIYGEKKLKS